MSRTDDVMLLVAGPLGVAMEQLAQARGCDPKDLGAEEGILETLVLEGVRIGEEMERHRSLRPTVVPPPDPEVVYGDWDEDAVTPVVKVDVTFPWAPGEIERHPQDEVTKIGKKPVPPRRPRK